MSQSSDRSRHTGITPVIIGGIFTILAAIIGLGVPFVDRLVNSQSTTADVSEDPPHTRTSPTEDLVTLYRPSLMNAVRLIGDVEARALFDLDATRLTTVFTREALKNEQSIVEGLQRDQVYLVSVRHDLKFEGFSVNADGTRAEVRANPTWEETMYSVITRQCLGYLPPMEVPQTVYLERTSNDWMTYAIVFDNEVQANWQPCA